MEWCTPPTCIQESQYATKGTILAGSGTGAPHALPLGAPGTVLTADATGGVAWSAPTATDTSFTPIPGVTAKTTMQGLCAEVASKVRHLVSTTEVSTTWKGNLIMDGVQMPLNTVHIAKAKGEPGQMCWGVDAGVAYVYVCTERDTWQRAALATWGA